MEPSVAALSRLPTAVFSSPVRALMNIRNYAIITRLPTHPWAATKTFWLPRWLKPVGASSGSRAPKADYSTLKWPARNRKRETSAHTKLLASAFLALATESKALDYVSRQQVVQHDIHDRAHDRLRKQQQARLSRGPKNPTSNLPNEPTVDASKALTPDPPGIETKWKN